MIKKVTRGFMSALLICSIVATVAFAAAEKPEIFPQLGHADYVKSVAFSPDGKFALSGSGDNSLRLWDITSGKEIRSFVGHKSQVESVAFSPDGQFALSGSWDNTVRLWDISTGEEVRTLTGHTSWVNSVAFSPDGKLALSGSEDNTIRLWDISTGKEMLIFTGEAFRVISVTFSPDGKLALSGDTLGAVRLWDITSGKEIRSFVGHRNKVTSVAFSPDGTLALSGSRDGIIRLWDIKTGKEIRSFEKPSPIKHDNAFISLKDFYKDTSKERNNPIDSVAFSPDGRFISSGGWDMTVRLWDVKTGEILQTFTGHKHWVSSVAFSPDGKFILSGSWDQTLRLWDISTSKQIHLFTGYTEGIKSVAFSPDGKLVLSGGKDNTLRLWDIKAGKEIRKFIGHTSYVNSIAFAPDGKFILSGSGDQTLRLWNIKTGKEIRKFFTGHTFPSNAVAFSPDGKLALSAHGGITAPTVNSSDNSTRDNTIRLWDVKVGKEIRKYTGHTSIVNSVAFSPDGKLALSGSWDNTMRLWDIKTGKEIRRFAGRNCVAFSPDGRFTISVLQNKTLRLWDIKTGKEVQTFTRHTPFDIQTTRSMVDNPIAFSPDGQLVLSGVEDETMLLWDIAKGEEVRSFVGHINSITSIAFSPDGTLALSGSWDQTTRIWDINTGRELVQLIGFTDGEWIAITPEGYFNASANGARHVNVRIGNNVYGIDQFYAKFYRPELVELALMGKEIKATEDIGALAKRSPAPTVSLVAPTSDVSVNKETITVNVAVKDNGGGIGDIIVYRNGVQVGNNTRSVTIKAKKGEGEIFHFEVSLSEGKNSIRIVAMNSEGSMESAPASVMVTAKIKTARPNLYAVVVGIDEYKNKSIALKFAVSDAIAFADILKAKAKPLFDQVRVTVLTKPEETTSDAIRKALLQAAAEVRTDDVFIFFNASHGVIEQLEGVEQYYLITSNVLLLSSDRVAQAALSQKELASLIGSISAQKKIIFLDTCHAGKAGKQIQLALLEQRTRGLTESTAIKLLQRAVGSSVFAASLDRETALEGYKGHGLFTYVLLDGMRGKADIKKDGYITVNGLKYYMEEEIMTLSEKVFNRQQTPVIEAGANFPFGKVQ